MFIAAVALASLLGGSLVSAIDRTTVAEQSAISDPAEQCTIYNFPPIEDEISKFPQVFTKAKILEGDDAARAKFEEISSKIPDIPPKKEGDIDTYDTNADPDCWWTATLCTQPKSKDVPADISFVPEPETLGYGFDDGPNCSHNAFYDHLTAQNQKATMFFIGSNVLAWPLQAKRAMDDGHEICVHTWSHPQMTTLSNEDAFAEIYYTMQAIKLLTGATPTCFRPPQGDIDDRIRAISTALGLTNILWQFDTDDSVPGPSGVVEEATVQENYRKFIETVQSGKFKEQGAILLAHEINNLTMQLAIDFYPQLRAVFKHIVPVGVAFNKTQPYVEKDFIFPDFAKYIETEVTGTTDQNGTPSSSSSLATTEIAASSTTASQATLTGGSSSTSSSASISIAVPSSASDSGQTVSLTTSVSASLVSASTASLEASQAAAAPPANGDNKSNYGDAVTTLAVNGNAAASATGTVGSGSSPSSPQTNNNGAGRLACSGVAVLASMAMGLGLL